MRSLKIATEQKAYEVGGKGTPVTNKMVTKVRAEELGCIVSIPATANKLIPESGLVKARTSLGRLILGSGRLTITRTGGQWTWDFSWSVPLPEDMTFSITYTNAMTEESYHKRTDLISKGSTRARGTGKDKFSLFDGTFVGTASEVIPSDSNYYFESITNKVPL